LATKAIPAIGSALLNMEVAMDIDRKRIAAVRALEALGYAYRGGEWLAPTSAAATPLSLMDKADAMHGALMRRADALAGCTEGSDKEAELRAIRGCDRGL
jgi:hypothetical protein